MDNVIFGPIDGAQRILTVFDDHILLEQVQNFRSFLTNDFFNGDKELYYCDMISCQFKEGTSMILGYLQFEVPGVTNRDNFRGENSFTFYNKSNELMRQVYEYVRDQIRACKTQRNNPAPSPAPANEATSSSPYDELLKLKQLLDAGVLTEEEFQEAKRKILKL